MLHKKNPERITFLHILKLVTNHIVFNSINISVYFPHTDAISYIILETAPLIKEIIIPDTDKSIS